MKFPKTMNIRVLQEDLDKGTSGDPFDCPLVHAARRHLRKLGLKVEVASVGGVHIWLRDPDTHRIVAKYNHNAREFISAIDNDHNPPPTVVHATLGEIFEEDR